MRMSDEQVEPDRLGPPCLGGAARSVAAMVPGRRSEAASPRHRQGFQPGGLRGVPDHTERPADAARMGARLQLDGDRIRINTPTKCDLGIPLPIPCRGRRIPLPDDTQIKSIECLNYLIMTELSAMRGESRASAAMLMAYSPCRQGNLERGAPAQPPGRWRAGAIASPRSHKRRILTSRRCGPTSISNNRSWCIGRSPRCGSARPGRISGIAPGRQGAAADR